MFFMFSIHVNGFSSAIKKNLENIQVQNWVPK